MKMVMSNFIIILLIKLTYEQSTILRIYALIKSQRRHKYQRQQIIEIIQHIQYNTYNTRNNKGQWDFAGMSNKKLSKQQLEQSYSKLSQQYNALLQKNQNDLIKIRQKQKTFNETILTLKNQKQELEIFYKGKIDVLVLEIEKYKNGVIGSHTVNPPNSNSTDNTNNTPKADNQSNSTTTANQNNSTIIIVPNKPGGNSQSKQQTENINKKEQQQQVKSIRTQLGSMNKQNKTLKQIIENSKQRIQHLEDSARKLIDQNIHLTSNFQKIKQLNSISSQKVNALKQEKQELLRKIKQLSDKPAQVKIQKQFRNTHVQSQGDYMISYKEHNALINKFNDQIKQLNLTIDQKQENNNHIKSRLKQTNDQLKRFMERDKKNAVLIKRKSEQLQAIQGQLQNFKKTSKTDRKRLGTQQSCVKCKQWQQQNKLLKEMVKSMQTMVRVKQMEAERYKNRQNLNNSKLNQKNQQTFVEAKRSRGQLPPLKKN